MKCTLLTITIRFCSGCGIKYSNFSTMSKNSITKLFSLNGGHPSEAECARGQLKANSLRDAINIGK